MMTLELEYFFLCSEEGEASHSPQRWGPAALHPSGLNLPLGHGEGGVRARDIALQAPHGHQEGLKVPAGRGPPSVPRMPSQTGWHTCDWGSVMAGCRPTV